MGMHIPYLSICIDGWTEKEMLEQWFRINYVLRIE